MNVPEGWTRKKIGEIGRWRGGGTPSKANPDFWRGGIIPWVSPKDMKSRIIYDAEDWITEEAVRDSATSLIPANSLIVVTRSGILRHSLPTAVTSRDIAINQDIKALTPLKEYDVHYIANIFWSLEKDLLDKCQKDGTTVESIDFDSLKNYSIFLPPLPEQHKIAAILSTWDDALSTLIRLIATKRQQKRALAEQLLTGQRRLKGFEGEWKKKKLGDVSSMSSGGTPKSGIKEYFGGGIPWASISDMTTSGKYLYVTERTLTKAGIENSAAKIFPAGTVLFAIYASVGKCNISGIPVSTSQAILGITPNNLSSSEYIYYLLSSNEDGYSNLSQHGTQKNLNAGIVKNLEINLPPLPEQQAIASILSTLDNELSSLERLQASVQEQKLGLMDALLTGRVRVNVEDA